MQKDEIGSAIQKRRDFLSLKQGDVAEMAGVSTKTIYLLEQGKGNASLKTIQKVMTVLGMELIVKIKTVDA